MLIVVTGMQREAKIIARPGITIVIGAARAGVLAARLDAALSAPARAVLSIGIAGGLSPSTKTGDCIVASEIAAEGEILATDSAWRAALLGALPGAYAATLAGSSELAMSPREKAALHARTGAAAIDMESHIAARMARDRGLPFASLRVVSDDAAHTLPAAARVALKADGSVALGAVLGSLARQPGQITALMRAARDSNAAFAALLRCRSRLGSGFLCPYLG